MELANEKLSKLEGSWGARPVARYRAYKTETYHESIEDTLFDTTQLKRTIDDIYRYPLKESARELINRRIRFAYRMRNG